MLNASAGRPLSAARDALLSFRLRKPTSQPTAGENVNATAPPTKPAQHKTGAAAGGRQEAAVHPAEIPTPLTVAVPEQTGSPQPAGANGHAKDTTSLVSGRVSTARPSTLSLAPQPTAALPPLSSASRPFAEESSPKSPIENAPTTGGLAFALQLNWQPLFLRTGAATTPSGAIPQADEMSVAKTVGNTADRRAQPSTAPNILTSFYAEPQQDPRSMAAEAQAAGPSESAQSTRSAGEAAPMREELVSQSRSGALSQGHSGAPAKSAPENDFLIRASVQADGSTATLKIGSEEVGSEEIGSEEIGSEKNAATPNTNGGDPAQAEEAKASGERRGDETGARADHRMPEPADAGSQPSDQSMPSSAPSFLQGDKQILGPARLQPADAQSTQAASGPSAGDSENATVANAGTRTGAKALGNLPAQKLSPAPGRQESPGTSAERVLFGPSVDPAGSAAGRSKAVAPGISQVRLAPTPEAAPAPRAASIREVSIRLGVATSSPVDVQVAAKAGKVQVAVRTPDLDLAQSLQTNLGELVGRLEQKGFKTEAWTPQTTMHTAVAVRQTTNSTANQGQSDQSGSMGQQPDARGGQRQSGQRQQGRWQAQLEETLTVPDVAPPASDWEVSS
jgi:hypothetical protein